MSEIAGDRVVLRPLRENDVPWLVAMLTIPEIAYWWHAYDADRVRRDLLGEDPWFAIEHEGQPIGAVGYWEETEPDYPYAGIDISLHPDWHEQGFGRDAVGTLARWLFEHGGHHRVVIDPAAENARAIRCYEAVGFKPVGVMRRYERDPAGGWRDGLLMDLLPEELANPAPEGGGSAQ
jgi:aminoglycoside 6'-N-acetyltransferase